jgi:hypothetical protein
VRLASRPGLYCPYCYEQIQEQQIEFRCTGQLSRSGKRCERTVDEPLRDRMHFTAPLPPAFAVDGRRNSAHCPRCGAETTVKICPVCHSRLPVHFGKLPSRLIVPVGAKESGKTVFMTVLVHELMNQAGQRLNASLIGADDGTRQRYTTDYEQPMYHQAELLPPTTPPETPNRAPLVFRFTTDGDGRRGRARRIAGAGRFGRGEPHRTLLSFFDTAGEDLATQAAVEQNVRYLRAADGILLLLDPLQMPGARALAAPGTRWPTNLDDDENAPVTVLENVTDHLLAETGTGPNQRISKPLAIVFTKMDALRNDLLPTSPLRQPPTRTSYFDERDSCDVHTEMQRLLDRWHGSRIDQIARKYYHHYRYFGVSALGQSPTPDNRVSPRGIQPDRVTSPILWLLAQFGIVPVK